MVHILIAAHVIALTIGCIETIALFVNKYIEFIIKHDYDYALVAQKLEHIDLDSENPFGEEVIEEDINESDKSGDSNSDGDSEVEQVEIQQPSSSKDSKIPLPVEKKVTAKKGHQGFLKQEKLKCYSYYGDHEADRDKFTTVKSGRSKICIDCIDRKLNESKDIIRKRLKKIKISSLTEIDKLKMSEIKTLIENAGRDAIYNKSEITILGPYKKCTEEFHENELDQWVLKKDFYVLASGALQNDCKPCASLRKKHIRLNSGLKTK